MAIFEANISDADLSLVTGEFFWHATTIENVLKMIKFDAGGLKAVGSGQLGPGFYVTGVRSDYQKGMARRSLNAEAPLFLLYVFFKDFYKLTPQFLTGWNSGSTTADFVAVSWYEGGMGGVGQAERGGFIPGKDGKRTDFKYGQYQQEQIADPALLKAMKDKTTTGDAFLTLLWQYASANRVPTHKDLEQLGPLGTQTAILGPKKQLKRSVLEMAFKTETALSRASVVGAKIFSATTDPVKTEFEVAKKKYSLADALVEPMKGAEGDPTNFHDEKWVDLTAMLTKLKSST